MAAAPSWMERPTCSVETIATALGISRDLAFRESGKWADTDGAAGSIPARRCGRRILILVGPTAVRYGIDPNMVGTA